MSDGQSTYRYFAACSPGLESLLESELRPLGISGRATPGGVEFAGKIETLWTCAVHSRMAESLRLRMKPFHALGFAELERELTRLPWHAYLHPNQAVDVRVSCSESKLYHTRAIAERVQNVLDGLWSRRGSKGLAEPNAPPTKVFVRIVRNEVSVSVDATGERLHRRGYRTHVGEAPLRETLAAAACRILEDCADSGNRNALWDPCCGSATLLCEWLHLKAGILPALATGRIREYQFERWPLHQQAQYEAFRTKLAAAPALAPLAPGTRAFGSDRDGKALAAAEQNLKQARVQQYVTLVNSDFREVVAKIPPYTAVITNLPYGVRLRARSTEASTFTLLDRVLLERPDLRPAVVVTTELPPTRSRNRWAAAARFSNGGLAVTAWLLTEGHSSG